MNENITFTIRHIKNGWLVSVHLAQAEHHEYFATYAAACVDVDFHLAAHLAKLRTRRGLEDVA